MNEKYMLPLEEEAKIRNLKNRSVLCYRNYASYFLNYMNYVGEDPQELSCQDVRDFLLAKKEEGLKATTLNLYNSAIRFFYRNVLHILWADVRTPRMCVSTISSTPSCPGSPAELNPIICSNQKLLYDALYHAASGTLDEFCADPKYLGAKIGYLCILHARESEINFHPHIHAIVLGGGLDAQNHWKGKRDGFFLPVHVVSRKLRDKYMAELKRLWQDGRLVFGGTSEKYRNHCTFHELMPKRFVRIRHYGILASRNKKKLITLCRNLLGCRAYLSQLKDKTGPEIIKQLWGVDICKCRHCGGRIVSHHKAIPLRN